MPFPVVPTEFSARQFDDRVLAVNADSFSWAGPVDMVLMDPPYNIAEETNFHTWDKNTIHSYKFDATSEQTWDTVAQATFITQLRQWADSIVAVLRPGGSFAVFCADRYLSHLIDALEAAGLYVQRTITWSKPNFVPINRRYMPGSASEFVVCGYKKGKGRVYNATAPLADADQAVLQEAIAIRVAGTLNELLAKTPVADQAAALAAGHAAALQKAVAASIKDTQMALCLGNYVFCNSETRNRIHPTQKPQRLLQFLVALYSSPDALLLDPFAGSGSTAHAALAKGRRAILVERERGFYEKQVEWLASATEAQVG